MSEIRTMSWLVTNGALWPGFSWARRGEIRLWLEMNGIHPSNVPVGSEIVLTVPDPDRDPEHWVIRYDEYCTDENGLILVPSERSAEVYVHEREVPLVIDPPMEWLIPL